MRIIVHDYWKQSEPSLHGLVVVPQPSTADGELAVETGTGARGSTGSGSAVGGYTIFGWVT